MKQPKNTTAIHIGSNKESIAEARAAVFVRNDSYDILYSASLEQCLVLSTLLHRRTVDKFFTE